MCVCIRLAVVRVYHPPLRHLLYITELNYTLFKFFSYCVVRENIKFPYKQFNVKNAVCCCLLLLLLLLFRGEMKFLNSRVIFYFFWKLHFACKLKILHAIYLLCKVKNEIYNRVKNTIMQNEGISIWFKRKVKYPRARGSSMNRRLVRQLDSFGLSLKF